VSGDDIVDVVDVAVIGGGLAGVRTAVGLHDIGASFVLLEAAPRLGGRIHTVVDASLPGGLAEVGARQIGQGYRRTWELLRRYGLDTVDEDVTLEPFVYLLGSEFISADAWASSTRNPFPERFRSLPLPAQGPAWLTRNDPFATLDDWRAPSSARLDAPIADRLRADGFSDEAIRLLALSLHGADVHTTSYLTVAQEHHRILDEIKLTSGGSMAIESAAAQPAAASSARVPIQNIVGGTAALVQAMAAPFLNSVRLSCAVTAVDLSHEATTITCDNGNRFRARRVVCAVPFTALRHMTITPALPDERQHVIADMPYTTNTRVWARVGRPFWEDDGHAPSTFSDAPFRSCMILRELGRAHTAMFLLSGDAAHAIDTHGDDIGAAVIASFEAHRPAARGALTPYLVSSWGRAPHVHGLRHSFRAGQMTNWMPLLAQSWHGLHFAGEHTREREMGMEAALESAERVLGELA
jgi:monoamine oxidase